MASNSVRTVPTMCRLARESCFMKPERLQSAWLLEETVSTPMPIFLLSYTTYASHVHRTLLRGLPRPADPVGAVQSARI